MFRNRIQGKKPYQLIQFAAALLLLSVPLQSTHAQQAQALVDAGNKAMQTFKAAGYNFLGSTERSINDQDAIGLRRVWKAGRKYLIVALIKDCFNCTFFVRVDQIDGPAWDYLSPEHTRSSNHTIATLALPVEPRDIEYELTFSTDLTSSFYTTIMLFESRN